MKIQESALTTEEARKKRVQYLRIENLGENDYLVQGIQRNWIVYDQKEYDKAKEEKRPVIEAVKKSYKELGFLLHEPSIHLNENGDFELISGICRIIALDELHEVREAPSTIMVKCFNNQTQERQNLIKKADNIVGIPDQDPDQQDSQN